MVAGVVGGSPRLLIKRINIMSNYQEKKLEVEKILKSRNNTDQAIAAFFMWRGAIDVQSESVDELVLRFEDQYNGHYKSQEDFVRNHIEAWGNKDILKKQLIDDYTDNVEDYIDWEKVGEELMYRFTCINGHYFENFC